MESGAFACLVLAVLSWQGLSQDNDGSGTAPTSIAKCMMYDSNEHSYSYTVQRFKTWPTDTGNNGMPCRHDGSISLRILNKKIPTNSVQVRIQHCESSWTDICDGDWSLQNISQFCNPKPWTGIVLVRP